MEGRFFKSPKKQRRKAGGGGGQEAEAVEEVGGNQEEPGPSLPRGSPVEPVTDAARAFRQLRVRPAMSGVEHHGRARSPQPRSPKKRKATVNIDKEFILKDDKVKRNTDQQGDISQARGMLGQLLFEFGQMELNKDLLEAIKRTESRTGRQSRSGGCPHELDRIAFEYVVAEAAELLHSQLATVAAHSEDRARQRALLRAYAVQAIATFADEDYSSEEEEEEGGGYASRDRSPSPPGLQTVVGGAARQGMEGSAGSELAGGSVGEGEGDGSAPFRHRSQSVDMAADPRTGSATPTPMPASPRGFGSAMQAPQQVGGQAQRAGRPAAAAAAAVSAAQAASGSEQVSSSILPDAPPDTALEDTAAQRGLEPAGPVEAEGGGGSLEQPQPMQRPGSRQSDAPAGGGGSLEGGQAQSSGLDDVMQQLSDAVDDMLRSPDAVTSRPRLAAPLWNPAPLPMGLLGSQEGSAAAGGESGPTLAEAQQRLFTPPGGGEPDSSAQQGQQHQAEPPQQPPQQHQHSPHLQPAAAVHQHLGHHQPRLHYHPHHRLQRGGQAPQGGGQALPALSEEGSALEAGAGGAPHSAHGSRLPLRSLPPQLAQQPQQPSGSGSGSGGTQQSDAHTEALKRQRTDALDRGQHQQLLQGRREATSPLFERPLQAQPQPVPAPGSPLEQQVAAGAAGSPHQQLPGPGQLSSSPGQHQPAGGAAASPREPGGLPPPHMAGQPQQGDMAAGAGAAPPPAEGSLETRGAVGQPGGSDWGSTLVCADLTVNDVASKYWPFLRSAMQGQGVALGEDDTALVEALVAALGEAIGAAYLAESCGRRPSPEAKSLIAATAFDDMFRDSFGPQLSGAESK